MVTVHKRRTRECTYVSKQKTGDNVIGRTWGTTGVRNAQEMAAQLKFEYDTGSLFYLTIILRRSG